jgi:hypothetical protein
MHDPGFDLKEKIRILRMEGYPPKVAVAIAYRYKRENERKAKAHRRKEKRDSLARENTDSEVCEFCGSDLVVTEAIEIEQ